MRKIDPGYAFLFGMIASILFFIWIATAEAKTTLRVDLYQVTPEGIAIYLGSRDLPIEKDIEDAIPGVGSMHCQVYFRDYNLNGIPEAPALLSCLDPEGGQHSMAVETADMENIHLET